MVRKIIGVILLIVSGVMFVGILVSFFSGGALLPHIIGPIVFLLAGAILVSHRERTMG